MKKVIFIVAIFISHNVFAARNGIVGMHISGDRVLLHETYSILVKSNYKMKLPRSSDTYDKEQWGDEGDYVMGAFIDKTYPDIVISVVYFKKERKIGIYIQENPVGFTPEGQRRADVLIRRYKSRYKDALNITERRNYKGNE